MSIGLYVVTNHKLFDTINKRHPLGVFSIEEFIHQIKENLTFFVVIAGESGISRPIGYIFVRYLDNTENPERFIYKYKDYSSREIEGFMSDLFRNKGIFFKEEDAENYRKDLLENEHKLYGEI